MNDNTDATVLVVDDEEGLVDLYTQWLTTEYDVRTATSGTEALVKADETVDVGLLDRRMPDMSGDEVLQKFRDQGLDCRVAMLTAVDPSSDIVDLPFDDYKVKPVNQNELHSLVEVLLKRATYDARSQEFFSLASKKATLEAEGDTETEEYQQLVAQIEEARAQIESTLDEVSAEELFRELPEAGLLD